MRTFTGDDIINCFKELDKRLPPDSGRVTVYMIGGGAMATRYDGTRVTTDVDYTTTGPSPPAAGRDKDVQDMLTLCERNGIDHPDTLIDIAAEVCDNPALRNDPRLRKTANRVCNHPRISGEDTRVRILPRAETDAPVRGANIPEEPTPPKNDGRER